MRGTTDIIQILLTVVIISIASNCIQVCGTEYYTHDLLEPQNILSHLTRVYTSNSGRKVYVFDDVIPHSLVLAARTYYSFNDNWRYVPFDKHTADPNVKFDSGNGIPWKSWLNPTTMSTTRVGSIFNALISALTTNSSLSIKNNKQKYHMTETYSAILRRGDVTNQYVQVEPSSSSAVNGYSVLLYTNIIWLKNYYGEALFYEEDDNMDIFGIVAPRFGRIVVWDSSIPYVARPPSFTVLSGQYVIFAQFHSDPKAIYEIRNYFYDYVEDLRNSYFREFVCSEGVDKVEKLDLDKHLTLNRTSKNRHFLSVFDGLFEKKDLDSLRTQTIKYGKYFYDDHLDVTSDNVQWIAYFNIDRFVNSRFWPVVSQIAQYVSGEQSWYPYNIACNLIRSADHTRYHLDTSKDNEKEMTFLLYLSPNWTASDQGETAFMEYNHDTLDNDYVAEVVPLYGRAVIFDGNFPHSARPPAPAHSGPRYTFAVKLSPTKQEALRRTFYETSMHSPLSVEDAMKQFLSNPARFAAEQKIQAVSQFLSSRDLQQQLDYVGESEESEQRENDDEVNDAELFDDDMGLLNEIGLLDGEMILNPSSMKKVSAMAHSMMGNMTGDDSTLEYTVLGSHSNVTDQYRTRTYNSWIRFCKSDTECLNNYMQLFLRRDAVLKEEKLRGLLNIL